MRLGLTFITFSIAVSFIIGYFFNQPLLGSIFFLFSEFLAGIYLITYKGRKIELTDIRLLLYSAYLLYSIFYPSIMLIGLLPYKAEIVPTTILFGTSFLGLNIANILSPVSFAKKTGKYLNNHRINKYSVVIHLILIFSFVVLLIKSGIPLNVRIGELSRGEIFKSVSQLWIVLVMLINASSIYNIYYFNKLYKVEKIVFIAATLLYIYIQLQLGNRRDYLPIILVSFCFFGILHNIKINLKVIGVISAIFLASFWITLRRNQSVIINNDNKVELAITSNEFIYPMQTLLYTIKDEWSFRFGYTYFIMPFEIIIPRSLYPNKPKTLGSEFVVKTFGKGYQGFAYTPTTEAYLNFGFLGPLLIFFVFGYFINRLIKYTVVKNNWLYYLVFYSLVFDFSRGEFSSFIYQILIMFSFILMMRIKNFKMKL